MRCFNNIIGLFVNFEDDNLHDLRSLMNQWCLEHRIKINKLSVNFCFPKYHYLQKYGLNDQLKQLRWLESLSITNRNFTELDSPTNKDYSNLCNWLIHNHGVAVFLGEPKGYHRYVYDALVTNLSIPLMLLEQNIKTREIWVGESDNIFTNPHQLN